MDQVKTHEYARALYKAHGDKAQVEAAQKAKHHEDAGETEEAETWRKIQRAISEMRGPHES
ncbi:hypothetical protein [Marivita geojedonensis]|uniref:Uncharacterized protein n=1 Tax=Marivita geojedonensis TaxID=1123756 RepID=A0A1X4NHW1_9RHOB|nr:hypothetical protein [Marivita geojedonensis]OSQ47258.1 hypothetical protein MGEO_16000 [Marivita geojedonensis]PRY76498.1 hypothetical protein CLV76_111119 [Marivita geojedonensis]